LIVMSSRHCSCLVIWDGYNVRAALRKGASAVDHLLLSDDDRIEPAASRRT
jgi:hypothetical protein